MLTRRSILLVGVAAPLTVKTTRGQAAIKFRPAGWPTGPIRIVVPFAAGGSIDTIARVVQPGLQQRLGNTIIVDNRPGASGSAGAATVAKSAADGATWLLCFDSQALNPFLVPNLTFDTEKDLDPVLLMVRARTLLLLIRPGHTRRSRTWSRTPRRGRIPSRAAMVGSRQPRPSHRRDACKARGNSARPRAYRGGGPSLNDAMAGHVDLISGTAALVSTGGSRPAPCARCYKPDRAG